jgi:transposase
MKYEQVTKNSPIGRALAYSINQEPYLRVFLSDGRVPMDNNFALYSGYFYPHLLSKSA